MRALALQGTVRSRNARVPTLSVPWVMRFWLINVGVTYGKAKKLVAKLSVNSLKLAR
jgi:hypothetical protein